MFIRHYYHLFCLIVVSFYSEALKVKYDQQRQKLEAEYSARYLAEQRVTSLEQSMNLYEQKSQDSLKKYMSEIDTVLMDDSMIIS